MVKKKRTIFRRVSCRSWKSLYLLVVTHFSAGASPWCWHSTLISYTICFAESSTEYHTRSDIKMCNVTQKCHHSQCLSTEAVIVGNNLDSNSSSLRISGREVGLCSSSPEVSADKKRSKQLFLCWSSSKMLSHIINFTHRRQCTNL